METNQPITSAVYSKQRGGKKPTKPEQPRRAERLVARMLGEDKVAELYASLGFKQPSERRRGRR